MSRFFRLALNTALLVAVLVPAVLLLISASAPLASAADLWVPDNYDNIQAAIDAASPEDTIHVRGGTYTENVAVNKSVTLIGENLDNTFVVGGFGVTADNVVIENFTIAGGYEWGRNKAGIYVASCDNVRISNNRIRNIQGGTGGTGGKYRSGDAGGVGAGIYLSSSTGDNLTSNTINNIDGGWGGSGGELGGSGGVGGVGAGIYLASSTGNNLTSNAINNIRGGTGGTGGLEGSGGAGGVGAGIYLYFSTGDNLTSNTINNIDGGWGGSGGDQRSPSGASQVGYGIYLGGGSQNNYLGVSGSEFNTLDGDPILYFYNMTGLVIENCTLTANSNPTNYGKIALISCTNFTVENNTIGNYVGMSGYTGWYDPQGPGGGTGGTGGGGVGIYLSSSTGNNLTSNTINNIRGGTGGTGGYGGSGGAGGVGAGIYLSSSTGDNLTSNTINNIQGGMGGTGGYWYLGGAGGVGAGIYLSSSTGDNLTSNTINNIQGGAGDPGGVGVNIYLTSSSSNEIFRNAFLDDGGASDGGVNSWDNGYPSGGNYWSDYVGADANGDGIGDTPYSISGDNNQDRYPLMNPWPVPHLGTAVFGLVNLYTVNVEKNLYLENGSKLVAKFYTYADAFENENVIENFSTLPWHVEENESARHPEGIGVKKVRLDLTTDDTENVISIIASFVVRRSDLMKRISAIKGEWPYADAAKRSALMKEIGDIKGQWPYAPA